MENQKKWAHLFEKVVGRKPSPQEFMAGKASGFDLKQIKTIAGIATGSDVAQQAETPSIPKQEGLVTVSSVENVPDSGQVQSPEPVMQGGTQLPPQVVKAPWSKKKKMKVFGSVLGLGILVALGFGYYHMDQKTGPDAAAESFLESIEKEDYATIATVFSSQEEEWKQADAKAFIQTLNDQVNLKTEIDKMAVDPDYIYKDDNGNQWLGMEKTGDYFGFFPTYKVVTYPVSILVQTNVQGLTLANQSLEKDKEVSLGQSSQVTKKYHLTGKTDLGEIDSDVLADRRKAENNELRLSLNAVDKTVQVKLPSDLPAVKDIKLFVNGKEVAKDLEAKVKVLENQNLVIHAQFSYEEGVYTTDEEELAVTSDSDTVKVDLELSDNVLDQIDAAEKVKAEKEEAAKKEKEKEAETRESIETFMTDYIASMRASIRNRQNQFAKYYDTSSAAYATMNSYVTDGGVARLNIDYQETLNYDVTNVTKEGDNYKVTVYNRFKEVYLNGKSDIVEKTQIFSLKPSGDSFQIYAISEY